MSADMMRRELLWRREWGVRSPSPCRSVHNYAVEALLHLLAVTQTRTLSRSHGAERDPAKIVCQVRIASLQIPPYLAIGFLCKIFCTKFDHAYHWMLMEWLFNRSDVEFKKKNSYCPLWVWLFHLKNSWSSWVFSHSLFRAELGSDNTSYPLMC